MSTERRCEALIGHSITILREAWLDRISTYLFIHFSGGKKISVSAYGWRAVISAAV